jgi:hypothetical protein
MEIATPPLPLPPSRRGRCRLVSRGLKYEFAIRNMALRPQQPAESNVRSGVIWVVQRRPAGFGELKKINPRYSYLNHLGRLPFKHPAEADSLMAFGRRVSPSNHCR